MNYLRTCVYTKYDIRKMYTVYAKCVLCIKIYPKIYRIYKLPFGQPHIIQVYAATGKFHE